MGQAGIVYYKPSGCQDIEAGPDGIKGIIFDFRDYAFTSYKWIVIGFVFCY